MTWRDEVWRLWALGGLVVGLTTPLVVLALTGIGEAVGQWGALALSQVCGWALCLLATWWKA